LKAAGSGHKTGHFLFCLRPSAVVKNRHAPNAGSNSRFRLLNTMLGQAILCLDIEGPLLRWLFMGDFYLLVLSETGDMDTFMVCTARE
jgi:hypothetical protein